MTNVRTRFVLVAWVVTLTGCSSVSVRNPFLVAPSDSDWVLAFARLPPIKQKALERMKPVVGAVSAASDSSLYKFGYGPPNGHPYAHFKIDFAAVIYGYDKFIEESPDGGWQVDSAVTFFGSGAVEEWPPSSFGSTFKLEWTFSHFGQVLRISGHGEGPEIRKGKPEAKSAEINQAFAAAFLDAMFQVANLEYRASPAK